MSKRYDNNKSWLTINTYVDIGTGEIIGHNMPKNYNKVMIIKKELKEDDKFRIIERTVGVREYGKQTELEFREFRIGK